MQSVRASSRALLRSLLPAGRRASAATQLRLVAIRHVWDGPIKTKKRLPKGKYYTRKDRKPMAFQPNMVAEHFYEPIPEHTPEEEIAKLFRTIKEGTKTMQEANPDFKIDTLGHFDMRIMFGKGNADSIRVVALIKDKPDDAPTQIQVYSNVKNGDLCAYFWDEKTGDWFAQGDGHRLREKLARELNSVSAGIPDF